MGEAWAAKPRAAIDAALAEQKALEEFCSSHSMLELELDPAFAKQVARLEEVRREVRWALMERGHKAGLWAALRARVQSAAWQVMLDRLRGAPAAVTDRKAAREVEAFTLAGSNGPALRQREDEAISIVLAQHFPVLKHAFATYARFALPPPQQNQHKDGDQEQQPLPPQQQQQQQPQVRAAASSLHIHGFSLLCKDIGLVGPELFATQDKVRAAVARYFVDDLATPARFSRSLLALADAAFEGHSSAAKVAKLIQDHLLRLQASKSAASEFHAQLWDDLDAIAVLVEHRDSLETLFRRVAGESGPAASQKASLKSVASFLETAGITSAAAGFGPEDLLAALHALMLDQGSIFFLDFVELLAAAVMFSNPDPAKPLAARLHAFCRDKLAPRA
jgi:hypothetical protein